MSPKRNKLTKINYMEEWSWERKETTNQKLQERRNKADDEADERSWRL